MARDGMVDVTLVDGLIGWHALGQDLEVTRRDAGRIVVERTDPLRDELVGRQRAPACPTG